MLQAICKPFSAYGLPDVLVSDNGPCYNDEEFKQEMKDMGVQHIKNS